MKLLTPYFTKLMPALLGSLLVTTSAQAWWNSEWTIRKKITVNTSSAGVAVTDPIGTTAVLIRLHDADLQFASAKDDGSDIRCRRP